MVGDGFETIPDSWEVRRLEDVSNIIDSLHKTPAYTNTGYPMVRVTDVKGGFLDLSEALRVSEDIFKEFTRRYTPKRSDIVFSRVGTYGNASYANTDSSFCLGQNTALISPRIDSRFLYYCLQSPLVRHQVDQTVVGSTQKTISLRSISALRIPIPPTPELKAIVHILGTLDDKIELNRQMNQTLEAMARTLFKSWFVDFDPVSAKAEGRDPDLPGPLADQLPDSFEDSELGEIPKGWQIRSFGDLLTTVKGCSYKSSELVISDTALVTEVVRATWRLPTRRLEVVCGNVQARSGRRARRIGYRLHRCDAGSGGNRATGYGSAEH
jgi:type I restriction enzyme S subunit